MKLNEGNSQTEFVCMCCMEYRWRQKQRRGWICPYRARDVYCPVIEHVYLREQYDEFSWAQMEKDIESNIALNKIRMEREATGEKTVHKMKLLQTHFDSVVQGVKTVEMRLDDAKRRRIKTGDLIEFSCVEDAGRKVMVKVLGKVVFLNFEELTETYSAKSLGFAGYDSSDICDYMRSLYGERRLKACHVVAIEFSLCKGEGNC